MQEKTIIHGLWLGGKFSHLENLTVNSFTKFGHEFNLWHYGELSGDVPKNAILRDGNEILSSSYIFKYPSKMLLGFGENSYVGFSELFRYKVLYELGGWWSDMDVTCMKSLDEIQDPYWFRIHGVLSVVGNIMKCPPKSELMKICFERAVKEVNENQDDWHHAIRILCYHIENLGLNQYIHKDLCNLDRVDYIWNFIRKKGHISDLPKDWIFIHWMNSVLQKHNFVEGSVYHQLLVDHNCYKRIKIF